jgi:putative ABC transport system substrate-binding protein
MKRRDFITLVGGTAVAWPLVARAQQSGSPLVGFLNGGSAPAYMQETVAFRQGLSSAGYDEGHNVTIEYRWAEGKYDRLRTLALDLIQRQVAVIFCNGPAVVAAKTESATIPIVFATSLDPVDAGLVESLRRPGGNLTGATNLLDEIGQKRLELMRSLLPGAKVVVALINPNFPNAEIQVKDLQAAAQALNLQLQVLYASSEKEIDLAFDA